MPETISINSGSLLFAFHLVWITSLVSLSYTWGRYDQERECNRNNPAHYHYRR